MQRAGIDARIDHRSLKDQKAELDALPSPTFEQQAQAISLDRPPTIHRGHSGNRERLERFDALQEVKVSQETKALDHIRQNTPKPSPAAPASSPAASLMDAKQGGKKQLQQVQQRLQRQDQISILQMKQQTRTCI